MEENQQLVSNTSDGFELPETENFFSRLINGLSAENDPEEQSVSEMSPDDASIVITQYSRNLIKIAIPVIICMCCVCWLTSNVKYFSTKGNEVFLYTPLREESATSNSQRFGFAIANTLIMISAIVILTFGIVLLFKYNCNRVLYFWLLLSTLGIFLLVFADILLLLLENYNLPIDYITFFLITWNMTGMAMISIHWKSPLILQQIFLLLTCIMIACTMVKVLPSWSTWVILIGLAVYDIVAVLCPYGPLRLLVNILSEREDPMPAGLIYSSTSQRPPSQNVNSNQIQQAEVETEPNEAISRTENLEIPPAISKSESNESAPAETTEKHSDGIKLGLGDFIFYSILIARVTVSGDLTAAVFCMICIVSGLVITIIFLALYRTALPALPFSIMFGLLAYLFYTTLLSDYIEKLATNGIIM